MAGHHAEHARQTATLRWVALGILIPNTFFVEAALGRFARCRYSAIQNNVQTNTYDSRRHGATPSLLSCRPSTGAISPSRSILLLLRNHASQVDGLQFVRAPIAHPCIGQWLSSNACICFS